MSEELPVAATEQPKHAKKASMDDFFELRWRKAYEVRALERECRQGKDGGRCGSADPRPEACVPAAQATAAPASKGADAAEEVPTPKQAEKAAEGLSKATSGGRGQAADPELAPTASEGHSLAGAPALRAQEVTDDDEDDEQQGSASDAATVGAPTQGSGTPPQPAQQHCRRSAAGSERSSGGGQDGAEAAGPREHEAPESPDCRFVWDSSSSRPGAATAPLVAAPDTLAARLKEQGNACLRVRDYAAAVELYTQAVAACEREMEEPAGVQASSAPGATTAAQPAGNAQPAGPAQQQQVQQHQQGLQSGGTSAPAAAAAQQAHVSLLATLHSNLAQALLKLRRHSQAAAEAQQAHRLLPTWPKPLYRLAQARLALGHWPAAVAACRAGDALSAKSSEGHSEFTPLMDRVATQAARAGSLVGFDGLQLEVRNAGEDAWLCTKAPHVPHLDGPEDEDSHTVTKYLPASRGAAAEGSLLSGGAGAAGAAGALAHTAASSASASASATDPLVAFDYRTLTSGPRRTSFRSIREAVEAAQDGDRILVLAGTHAGMGETVHVSKRVLIEGQGELGQTVFDQRANSPSFRITRSGCVLRNLVVDHSGFHEAVHVDSAAGAPAQPLLMDLQIKCSGDDAVNISGTAAPTLLRCELEAKKVGLKAYGAAAPRLERCVIQKCGQQGVRAMEAAEPLLYGCVVTECGEEAVVAMDAARITLQGCSLSSCKGPAVDVSGGARASVIRSKIESCVGGVWLWDASSATVQGVEVSGGPSHAILADGSATAEVRESRILGSVHATDSAWEGILHSSNTMDDPEQPTDFPDPGEPGPFRFVPDKYRRKQ